MEVELKNKLTKLALGSGAGGLRSTTCQKMQGPPTADPAYIMPEAASVISFFVPLGRDYIPDYFGKVTRARFKEVMYHTYQRIGKIARELAALLESAGFKTVIPAPNKVYRNQDNEGWPHLMLPPFSHRYAALASGLASLGWSGNVLVPGHHAAAFFGSVITDASLEPDEPVDLEICDKCKLCTLVCPGRFFEAKEAQTFKLGGHEYQSGKKHSHLRCAVSCAGLAGLSRDKKWSSWSTGRLEIPDSDDLLPELWMKAAADPANEHILSHSITPKLDKTKGEGILGRSAEETNPTCCNCLLVCSGPREWRENLVKLLHSSGIVSWEQGREVVRGGDPLKARAAREALNKVLNQT